MAGEVGEDIRLDDFLIDDMEVHPAASKDRDYHGTPGQAIPTIFTNRRNSLATHG